MEPKDLTLTEYVKAFNSPEFRELIKVSLAEKREALEIGKKKLADMKLSLRLTCEDLVNLAFKDHAEVNDILTCFWFATWKTRSWKPLRELEELANQVRNLEATVQISKALDLLEKPQQKQRRGFSDEEVQAANQISILNFLSGNIRKSANRLMVNCPFHKEKTGSFVIYSDNSWHCFGCGANGQGAIDFVKKQHDMDFLHAVGFLLGRTVN